MTVRFVRGPADGMKAIVCREYGSAAIEERDWPSVPDGAVLVRVRAGALNTVDWFLAMGRPYFARLMAGGVRRPRVHVVGMEFAGTVEAVGGGVTNFQPGDDVFGAARGSLAEYVVMAGATGTTSGSARSAGCCPCASRRRWPAPGW